MTPQTAAALRALEADIRYNAKRFLHMQALFRWADELAAVLTQEAADKKLSFADGIELAGARGICRSAIIPESAEGAGTWDNILTTRNDYITAAAAVPAGGDAVASIGSYRVQEDGAFQFAIADHIPLVTEWTPFYAAPAPRGGVTEAVNCREAGPGKGLCTMCAQGLYERCYYVHGFPPAEPRAAEGAGAYEYQRLPTLDEQLRSNAAQQVQPTAAAAVPAGGDAEHVTGGLKTDAERADALDSLATALESDLCTMGDRIQAAGWLQTFAYQLRNAPAPRGGVTEEMVREAYEAWDRCPSISKLDGMRAALEAALSVATPPAAQAQDAGPMARHWREAFAIWAGNRTAMGEFDRIEKRARALAAKEAK